ncbi:NAD(P)H-binding protein [Microvirga aerilata]|uniref:NAD(P)H-binding protein n=1 Tax=Microvirga aerilata TaxID=670292 RepID=A0A936ZJD1_9HYPH|nr:NAD(P)H-binding protein [Microvirga aerilata]MBL0405668.1 NAD(P)H-binding protein [Microvirga aerilata]
MTNVLILGAHGQIARVATDLFLTETDAQLTLYLRNAKRLKNMGREERVRVVEGDVLDVRALQAAMAGQDVVYANLAGAMEQQARCIVQAMEATGVRRLIFISSMGIYDEVPGERHGSILDPYRNSARVIEASDLDYTIVRPAWLNDRNEIAYGITLKGQPFANPKAYVSRKSVADLVVKLATTRGLESRQSLGVHKAA